MSAPTDKPPRRSPRGAVWAALAVLTTAVVVLGVLYATGKLPERPGAGPTDPAVHSARDSRSMDLPGESRVASVEFDAEAGDTAVVTFSAEATLESSIGNTRAAFTVTGVSCSAVEAGTGSSSKTGTENLENQVSRSLTVRQVFEAKNSGKQRCNATIRVPAWDRSGPAEATMDVDSVLEVEHRPGAFQEDATADAAQPIVVGRGEKRTVIDKLVDLPSRDSSVELGATSHLTTCTIENGSKDRTHYNLCTPGILDERGSTVTVRSYAYVLNDGQVCESVELHDERVHINDTVHHKLLGTPADAPEHIDNPCGGEIRLVQTVQNDGPAPVVVHRNSSNIVLASQP